jgi:hypothetical protein
MVQVLFDGLWEANGLGFSSPEMEAMVGALRPAGQTQACAAVGVAPKGSDGWAFGRGKGAAAPRAAPRTAAMAAAVRRTDIRKHSDRR